MAIITTELLAHYDTKIKELISSKVDQEDGKSLMTDEERDALNDTESLTEDEINEICVIPTLTAD